MAEAGVTRVSIGVQDFDPKVQAAINREQSFETTQTAVAALRAHGIDKINIDLVYGLPHQTRDSVEETIEKVLALAPSRIAMFGYAHLPERLKHQRLIDETALPGVVERFAQSNRLAHIARRRRLPAHRPRSLRARRRSARHRPRRPQLPGLHDGHAPMRSSGSAPPRSGGCRRAIVQNAVPIADYRAAHRASAAWRRRAASS